MLKFFGKSYFIQYLSLVILGLILWSPAFTGCVRFPELNEYNGILAESLEFLRGLPYFISVSAAFILVYISGILINKLAQRFLVIDKNSLYVILMFIVLSSLFVFNMVLAFHLVAGLLMSFFVLEIFRHEVTSDNIVLSFNTGFYLGLIGLIYYPAFFLVLIIWVSLKIIGGVTWRNSAASFIGAAIVLFGDYLYYFFSENESLFFEQIEKGFKVSFQLFSGVAFDNVTLFYLIILAIFFLAGIFAINNQGKLAIRQRKLMLILGLLSVSLVVILLFFNSKAMIFLMFPVVAIIIGNILEKVAGSKRLSIIFYITVILILINNWISCL